MRIRKTIEQELLSTIPSDPPEVGGLLGGVDGVVTVWYPDEGRAAAGCACSYTPNVEQLNRVIADWQEQGIAFLGLFHTHFFGVSHLSEGDEIYIRAIMEAMPPQVSFLYFPLAVLPERRLEPYLARRVGNTVEIRHDELKIL